MSRVIVILGPTASGKTKVSIELAKKINGEIISADSMQIYKYMDIGTAKPDASEMDGIRHYLIDEVTPSEEFNVTSFQKRALSYIEKISNNKKIPIITGGTGLYINSLVYNINFSETVSDWELRDKLSNIARDRGNQYLHAMLKEIDPTAAEKIHENNVKRVIRAIEVFEHTKKTITQHQEISREIPPIHEFLLFGLNLDREILYQRINQRVDIMFERGLVNEVIKLKDLGYHNNSIAIKAIGYKELLEYLDGKISIEEAREIIKQATRNYAKRQLTWFKRLENVTWINTEKFKDTNEIVNYIIEKVNES